MHMLGICSHLSTGASINQHDTVGSPSGLQEARSMVWMACHHPLSSSCLSGALYFQFWLCPRFADDFEQGTLLQMPDILNVF